jgi:TonB family protein
MGPAHGPATSELEQARTAPEFGAHTPLAEKLLAVAIRAQNFTGSSGVAIALTEGADMVCRASWGTSAPDVGAKLSIDHGFTGLCARTGEPLRCDDAQSDPRVDPEACRALGISAIAVAPVRRGLKVVGVIAAFSDTPNAFTDKHLLILTTLSEVIVELLDETQAASPAGHAADQHGLEAVAPAAVAVLDQGVFAPTQGVESAAVFEDDLFSEIKEPPAKMPAEARDQRKTPTVAPETRSEPAVVVPPPRQSSAMPARPPAYDGAADLFELPRKQKDDIAPVPVAQDRGEKAGTASSVRLVPLRQPSTDSVPELTFSGYESLAAPRRWWLVAAILILLALIGWGGWRWYVGRSARMAAAAAPVLSPTSALPTGQMSELKPADSTPVETKRSAFTPAPSTASPAKAVAASEAPDDVTVRHVPEAVIETDAPVRRPAAGGKSRAAQVPEAQAPQLALSSPELPSVLGKPSPSVVAAPVSHMIPAQLVTRVAPAYPEAARRMNISSKVILKATIGKTGNVGSVEWVSGSDMFRNSAVAAVKQWRYKPATLNGQSIESELQIVLQFKPQSGH